MCKQRGIRHYSLLPLSGKMFSHFCRWAGFSSIMFTWEDEHPNSKWPSFILLSLNFYCGAWHLGLWDMPLVTWCQLSQLCSLLTSCPTLNEDIATQAYFCLVLLRSVWLLLVLLCLVEAIHADQKQVLLEVSAVPCYSQDIQGFHLAILPDQFHHFLHQLNSIINPSRHVTPWSQLEMLYLFYCWRGLIFFASLYLSDEVLEFCWKLVPIVYIASMGWHIHPFSYQQKLPGWTWH